MKPHSCCTFPFRLPHQDWLKRQRGRRTGFPTRTSVAALSASASLTPVSPSITAGPVDRACVTAAHPTAAPSRLAAGIIPYECVSRATRNPETFSRTGFPTPRTGSEPRQRRSCARQSAPLRSNRDSSIVFNLQLKLIISFLMGECYFDNPLYDP